MKDDLVCMRNSMDSKPLVPTGIVTFIWIFVVAMGGCEESLSDGMPNYAECDACHRSATNPYVVLYEDSDAESNDSDTDASLGTNTVVSASSTESHLVHQMWGIGCDACHIVPATINAEGHIDALPAEVTFSEWEPPGRTVTPVWDPLTKTCWNTYCHGGPDSGRIKSDPKWTDVATAGGPLCTDCHGTEGRPPQTGAHAIHDAYGVSCSACHIVPATVNAAGHIDKYPAEVVFGVESFPSLAVPAYDVASKRCVNTYCHGATMIDGVNTAPFWTTPSTGSAACDSCHGFPPLDQFHWEDMPTTTGCYTCHKQTLNEDDTINIAGGYHINGINNSNPMGE